jgi:long-chain acyl-CoA synthetase
MKTFHDLINKIKIDIKEQGLEASFLALIKNGVISSISYKVFLENIEAFASFLISNGFKKDDGMVLMLDSSPSWLVLDMGSMKAGGIVIPMFANIALESLKYQLENSTPSYICVQDVEAYKVIKKTDFNFKKIFTLTPFPKEFLKTGEGEEVISVNDAIKEGGNLIETSYKVMLEVEKNTSEDDITTIIYTSGTSGRPKGVELTHKNIISQLGSIDVGYKDIMDSRYDTVFSFLPLAHIFQRTVSYYFLSRLASSYFSSDVKTIADDLSQLRPTVITVVPRFLEKVRNGLNEKIKNESSFVRKILGRICYKYAVSHNPNKKHSIFYPLFDKLMYSKIREKLGGKLKAMISGGAGVPPEVYRFFVNIGLPLYQGYGLTETSPVVAVNTPLEHKIYTIGKPIKDVEVKLSPDGELLVKGPNVMKGYHKADGIGARVIDENGFLATGDLAKIDEEGYITLIGRKKEQFKTSNGKFINPVIIENLLNAIPYIETSCAIAEGRPYVCAILFPSEAGVSKLEEIKAHLAEHINEINEHLDKHEHVNNFYLHSVPASIENGEITPSMKIIRNAISKKFTKVIEGLYSKKRDSK